jgi:amino-acid N-acetyltransferase
MAAAVQVMGCAMMLPLGVSPDGARVAEIGAFCVDVVFRGTGRGDSLLDYVEQVGHAAAWESVLADC